MINQLQFIVQVDKMSEMYFSKSVLSIVYWERLKCDMPNYAEEVDTKGMVHIIIPKNYNFNVF